MLSRQEILFLSAVSLGIFMFCAAISVKIFQSYPLSLDESSMMFQARLFAEGRFSYPAEPFRPALNQLYTIVENDKVFSKYPPGFPAILSIGILIGSPDLVNPLISTLTALLIFLSIRNIVSIKAAWLTLGLLASSPYFYPYGASFFSQPLSLFLVSLCFFIFSGYKKNPDLLKCISMGICVAALFLTRQLDATCLAISIAFPLLIVDFKRRRFTHILLFCLAAFLGISLLLVYNYIQIGKLSISTFPIWSKEFVVTSDKASNLIETINHVVNNYITCWRTYTIPSLTDDFVACTGFGIFSCFVLGCFYPMPAIKKSMLLFIALIVSLYAFHPSRGWPVYGSRYWYCAFGPFIIIAANFLDHLRKTLQRRSFLACYSLMLILQIGLLVSKLSEYDRQVQLFNAIQMDIENSCAENSIVLLKAVQELKSDNIVYMNWWDFQRNSEPLGNRLYTSKFDDAQTLKNYFPVYTVCEYDFRGGQLQTELPNFPPKDSLSALKRLL